MDGPGANCPCSGTYVVAGLRADPDATLTGVRARSGINERPAGVEARVDESD